MTAVTSPSAADLLRRRGYMLFLASRIPRRYAERFLRPEQIDDIDIDKFSRRGLVRVAVADPAS